MSDKSKNIIEKKEKYEKEIEKEIINKIIKSNTKILH